MNRTAWEPTYPPGLEETRRRLEALYGALYRTPDRRKPLMFMGAPGIGKTVMTNCFVELYLEDNPEAGVRKLNVAALTESLIESELFGHVRGAYTGAIGARAGHIGALSDGGLLILEEVGEISPHIQAKLLTVIEDGVYYPVGGDTRQEAAAIQIVGTTNKPREHFRQDFFDRFLYFDIPALHQRRQDVLPYLRHFLGDGMKHLTRYDLLALMAYHWPGNVRGVEKISDAIKWRAADPTAPPPRHLGVLTWEHGFKQYKGLNAELNKCNLSLFRDGKKAFRGGVPDSFDREYRGLELFCNGTGQDVAANYNLMNLKPTVQDLEAMTTEELNRLYLIGKITGNAGVEAKHDIAAMTYREQERLYLETLLNRTGGNKSEAARRAGVKYQTFVSMLKRCGIS